MDTTVDINLKNYLAKNLEPERYASLQYPHHKASRLSVLAELSVCWIPDDVLCLIKEFFVNLSSECIIEYVNRINDEGKNIFFYCKDVELMKVIIGYACDINARCNEGNNVLMTKCDCDYNGIQADNIEMIELLLDNGADVNATSACGYTPLMNYCSSYCPSSYLPNDNFESIVELLIRRGACVFTRSCIGLRALDFVRDTSLLSEELLQLLRGEVSMSRTKNAANVCAR